MIEPLNKKELEEMYRFAAENKIIEKINEIVKRVNKLEGIIKNLDLDIPESWWK